MDFQELSREIEKVYFYIRVSTKKQVNVDNEYNIGIQAQAAICAKYYKRYLEGSLALIPEIVSDVGSTFNNQDSLPNLDRMLRELPEKSLILITDVSRLGRNVYHSIRNYEIIEKSKCYVIAVNENKIFGKYRQDDLYFFQKTIEAESFSIEKSINTKARIELIRERGGHVGGIKFGKRLKKSVNGLHRIENNPKEQLIIRKIIGMHIKKYSGASIKRCLDNNPSNKYRNKPISQGLVYKIIKDYRREQKNLTDHFNTLNVNNNN